MSCLDSDKCKEYKQNRGNPYPWQSPCNFCDKNMSDYELGYIQSRIDVINEIIEKINRELDNSNSASYICEDGQKITTDVGYVWGWFIEYQKQLEQLKEKADERV